ncbi:MAG: hypothetical protein ACI8SE_001905 [Bacteroidia bacterium]|jgi:hypothetical protein
MNSSRIVLAIWIISTVLVGLISRSNMVSHIVPLAIGDLFYATMIYFMVAIIWPKSSALNLFILAFGFCAFIEFGQLLQWDFLVACREHWLGKLILGNNFKWLDLVWYLLGAAFGLLCDKLFIQKQQNVTTV